MAQNGISAAVDLTGQVAIVTGGARGIGQATALALAREGADVVVGDMLDTDETVKKVEALGRRAAGLRTDVTSTADNAALVAAAVDGFGRLDVLVTCAGVYGEGALEVDADEFDRVVSINAKGTYLSVQAAWSALEDGGGKVVCIGSIAGKVGGVLAGPQYAASKGAVHAMVRWFAKYGASRGVLVNGIAPGAVATEMIKGRGYRESDWPLGRFAEPEDMAEAVVYLAGQGSNFLTGKVLSVDGGLLLQD